MPPQDPELFRRALLEELGTQMLPVAIAGPVLELTFPTAATRRDVPHGLPTTPDGYWLLLQSGGQVSAVDVHLWSPTIAWLVAGADNTWARVCFYALRPNVIRVVTSR